jgi:phosphoglycolate phosphatase
MESADTKKLIAFDWDGTLCDSDFLLDRAVSEVLTKRGLIAALEFADSALFRTRERGSLALRLPIDLTPVILEEVNVERARLEHAAQLFKGVKELLVCLRTRGHFLAVITGRDRPSFNLALERLGLCQLFDLTLCAAEYPAKPQPEGLLMAKHVGNCKHLVYVGNMELDLIMAKSAGAEFIGVSFGSRAREFQIRSAILLCWSVLELEVRLGIK